MGIVFDVNLVLHRIVLRCCRKNGVSLKEMRTLLECKRGWVNCGNWRISNDVDQGSEHSAPWYDGIGLRAPPISGELNARLDPVDLVNKMISLD